MYFTMEGRQALGSIRAVLRPESRFAGVAERSEAASGSGGAGGSNFERQNEKGWMLSLRAAQASSHRSWR